MINRKKVSLPPETAVVSPSKQGSENNPESEHADFSWLAGAVLVGPGSAFPTQQATKEEED